VSPSGKAEMVMGEYVAFNFAANDLAIFTEFPQLVMMMLHTPLYE